MVNPIYEKSSVKTEYEQRSGLLPLPSQRTAADWINGSFL